MQINKIVNANLYIGGKNFLGTAEELNLGQLKAKMVEHKALGMVGVVEFPAGFEKITGKIKWNSYYEDAFNVYGNPYKYQQIQARADVESYDGTGRSSEKGLVVICNAMFTNLPLGTFKQHDNVEMESDMSIVSATIMFNGQNKLQYDATANVYMVNGVDVLKEFHRLTGA